MDLFYCYDVHLFDHLREKGFKYLVKARHYTTLKTFSIFLRTEELNKEIGNWMRISVNLQ